MEDQMLNMISYTVPRASLEVGTNIHGLVEDLALLLSDMYYELDSLRYKYNIEEKDLLPFAAVLSRGESIPARTVNRANGDKK
jgi:hypothetical protein